MKYIGIIAGVLLATLGLAPYILMLCLGAFGHQMDIPYLFKFGFWECVLGTLILGSLGAVWRSTTNSK